MHNAGEAVGVMVATTGIAIVAGAVAALAAGLVGGALLGGPITAAATPASCAFASTPAQRCSYGARLPPCQWHVLRCRALDALLAYQLP